MNPVNRLLAPFGVRLARGSAPAVPADFVRRFEDGFQRLQTNRRGFAVVKQLYYDAGDHPSSYMDFECAFAGGAVAAHRPTTILDIGSYRGFISGLLGHYPVTTLDVRERKPATPNETVLTSDAKAIGAESGRFDLVVSLCALEHFGLGRYGDEFDPDADEKALAEIVRVLRPGGALVLSTTLTRARPTIAFNAHRIYDRAMIHAMFGALGLKLEREAFFSNAKGSAVELGEITDRTGDWDVYCGYWVKPAA